MQSGKNKLGASNEMKETAFQFSTYRHSLTSDIHELMADCLTTH
jgi:hypothetical protein